MEVTDGELGKQLKDYLNAAKNTKASASKDTEKKITRVDFEGDLLAYLIGLEHR